MLRTARIPGRIRYPVCQERRASARRVISRRAGTNDSPSFADRRRARNQQQRARQPPVWIGSRLGRNVSANLRPPSLHPDPGAGAVGPVRSAIMLATAPVHTTYAASRLFAESPLEVRLPNHGGLTPAALMFVVRLPVEKRHSRCTNACCGTKERWAQSHRASWDARASALAGLFQRLPTVCW